MALLELMCRIPISKARWGYFQIFCFKKIGQNLYFILNVFGVANCFCLAATQVILQIWLLKYACFPPIEKIGSE